MSGVFTDNETGEVLEPTQLSGTLDDNDTQVTETDEIEDDANDVVEEIHDESGESGEADTPPVVAEPPKVEPPQVVEDPGEFKPNDYSFDVTLADGTVIKIANPEDIKNIPQDADFGSPAAFLEVQASYLNMVNGIASDKKAFEDNKASFEKQQEEIQQREQWVTTTENELKYLESKGKLPAIPAQYKDANWTDPEVAKQPGVKERLAILEYAVKENQMRQEAGLSPMSMLEAFNEMRNNEMEEERKAQAEKAKEVRKQRGAMVGGVTSGEGSSIPSNMIVGRGGSLSDL